VLYCIALLVVAVIALAVYYGLSAGACEVVETNFKDHVKSYVKVASDKPFCVQYVYPTANILPGCVWAAFSVLILAVNLLAAYHGMMGDHLAGNEIADQDAAYENESKSFLGSDDYDYDGAYDGQSDDEFWGE